MRLARSLRWRLLGLTLLGVCAALALTGWFLGEVFREHVTAQFETQLQRRLDQLTALFELDPQGQPQLRRAPSDPRWSKPFSGLYWQIESLPATPGAEPATLARSRSLWDQQLQLPPGGGAGGKDLRRHHLTGPQGQSLWALERQVRIGSSTPETDAEAGAGTRWRLIVATEDSEVATAIQRFNGLLTLFLVALGLGLLLAAGLQVYLGLRPLRDLQAMIRAVGQGQAPRLQGPVPAELDELVREFNRVLEQNERVVQRARQQAGNLAHAIKTPLAVLGGLADGCQASQPALAAPLREQVDQIREQVDWHLARARLGGAGSPALRTPVLPVIEGLVRVMHKVHAQREDGPEGLRIEVEAEGLAEGLVFAGESQDLQEMVGNLLDNACKWARQQVRVSVGVASGDLAIVIDDDGPGLSPAQRQHVFGRGVRADERRPGSGLGLAIARENAQGYGGDVGLADSPLGGLRARLLLPLREPVPAT